MPRNTTNSVVAKGRKPQFSFDDLERLARAMFGSKMTPTGNPTQALGQSVNDALVKYLDPRDFGKPNRLATDVFDYANPAPFLTAEETRRLVERGPDRGHLASAALLAGLLKAPKIYRAVKSASRASKELFQDAPRGSSRQPRRTATANMGGIINDPMAQYAAIIAATNRR